MTDERFDEIHIQRMPVPDAVTALDYEAALERLNQLMQLNFPDWTGTGVESDPITKILQIVAEDNVALHARNNVIIRAQFAASATNNDLDNIVVEHKIARKLIDPGDPTANPPRAPIWESDDSLLQRYLLAPEAMSVAGPRGAWKFHALQLDASVADASVDSPTFEEYEPSAEARALLPSNVICITVVHDAGLSDPFPGDTVVYFLTTAEDGQANAELLDRAPHHFKGKVPTGHRAYFQSGTGVPFAIQAELDVIDGPDKEAVRAAAEASVNKFIREQRQLGEPITIDGLHAALRVSRVREVFLHSPVAGIYPGVGGYPLCTSVTVEVKQ